MKGQIIKIHPIKRSRNGGQFVRVEFRLEDRTWAKTDLVISYRNYNRWKYLIKVGVNLEGLLLKRPGEVNADSFPRVIDPGVIKKWQQMPDGSMAIVEEREEIKPLEPAEPELIQTKLF
ncbi:MAG: hypothetical protein WCH62_05185 [Candidatus Omnitrophota bacterium]